MAILACLEKVLMETGADYNLVLARLKANDLTLVDCCEQTKYLKDALKEVFGEKSNVIIDKIIEYLKNFDEEEEISIFLEKLKK